MDKDNFNYRAAAEEFSDERSVWKQIWKAICEELCPNKKNWFGTVLSLILGTILSVILARSKETVSLAGNLCGILLDVQIAIFGCIFAVYSILLAFLSDDYIKKLVRIGYHDHTSYLKASTKYYEAALFIYFVAIGVSLIYKLIIECMPQYYILTDNNQVNELLSGIALFIYFVYSIRVVYELKSIIGNTLLLFRTSIQFRILSFEKSETSDLQNEECSSNNVANRE